MTFSTDQHEMLTAPLDKARVATREQGGKTLSYIEAWHAIAEANRIFGFGQWDRETVELRQLGEPRVTQDKYGKDQMRVGYSARVRITVRAGDSVIVREGCGFGSGIDKDTDQAHESALKEAESDAMKRALMTFGNPFGLALYDKTQANVAAVVSAVVQTATASLAMCRDEADLKEWSASNGDMIAGLSEVEKQGVRKAYAARQTAIKSAANPFEQKAA
jgi:DNA repair and recombination protein RAD52